MSVTREEMHEEVWAEPMTKVAVRHRVSSSFLARVCDRMNVPRPGRGYWARREAGEVPHKPALPRARPGDELEWVRGREPRRVPRPLPRPPTRAGTKSARTWARPEWHELLVGAREHFEAAPETDGFLQAPGYLRPSKKLLVDMFVTKGTLAQALETANQLFLGLDDRGYEVTFAPHREHFQRPPVNERAKPVGQHMSFRTWSPHRPTIVSVGTVAIGLTLFELSEEVPCRYVAGKLVRVSDIAIGKRNRRVSEHTSMHQMPSGRLCVRATSPYRRVEWEKRWIETQPGELVSRVSHLIGELRTAAGTIAKLVEEAERVAAIERERWLAEVERQEREEAERRRIEAVKAAERKRAQDLVDSREELLAIVASWDLSKRIERFFAEVEDRRIAMTEAERTSLQARVRRAQELIGDRDALAAMLRWKAPEER